MSFSRSFFSSGVLGRAAFFAAPFPLPFLVCGVDPAERGEPMLAMFVSSILLKAFFAVLPLILPEALVLVPDL